MSYGQGGGNPNPFGDVPQPNPYAPPVGGVAPNKPLPPGTVKNYLTEAILCLVCCGGVIAIPAIIYAAQVNSKLAAGDYKGAVESSESAKKWCMIAFAVGLVCGGLGAALQILAIIAENA